MKLKIPFVYQETAYTCGPAVLQMAFSFLGKFKSEKRLATEAGTNSAVGTTHQGMIDTALQENFYCYINQDSTIEEIKYFVKLGFPVIVDYTEPSSDEGHYSIVSGYQDGHIILNDPWNGKGFSLTTADFLSRWHDSHSGHRTCVQWMMVLSKEPFNLGRQYAPNSKK